MELFRVLYYLHSDFSWHVHSEPFETMKKAKEFAKKLKVDDPEIFSVEVCLVVADDTFTKSI